MGSSVAQPGKRLLPTVIDEIARDEPNRIWASLPIDDYDLSKGYEDISYATFANAINKLAWLIVSTVGRSSDFDTVAYLGVPDVRYHMIQMAVCKTGHKVLFTSQLNSLTVHNSLLKQTDCKAVFSAVGVRVDDLRAAQPMVYATVPELDELLDFEDIAPPFPYTKTFQEAFRDPYLVLHSSGTTGDPTPAVYNHAGIAAVDSHQMVPEFEGRPLLSLLYSPGVGVRFLMVTSPYHVLSAGLAMIMSVFGGGVFVPGFRHRGVGTSEIVDILNHAKVKLGMLTPWMMESIARRADAKSYIESFDTVFFGGAAMSQFAIDLWGKYTRIQNVWGSTETLSTPFLVADNEDASYIYFEVIHSGLEFRQVVVGHDTKDAESLPLYDMVFTLSPESVPYACWHARCNITLDSPQPYAEYAIGDLWTPHPDPKKAKYAWRFVGRADDLVQFSTGVNIHPGPIEKVLSSQKIISGALVLGNGRQQPVGLVELAPDSNKEEATQLWEDVISRQNEAMPVHGRIAKTHTIFVPSGSFVRTSKGTIVRKHTEKKFSDLINSVYEDHGDEWQDGHERYGSIVATVDIAQVVD